MKYNEPIECIQPSGVDRPLVPTEPSPACSTPSSRSRGKIVNSLIEQLGQLDRVERGIIWYGPAWKWTIHYALITTPSKTEKPAGAGAEPSTLCYVVPKIEQPCICVPLSDDAIAHLPMTRLSKFIRDGIKMAKCAVAIHWAVWTPNSQSEVAQIMEPRERRRHKTATTPAKPKARRGR